MPTNANGGPELPASVRGREPRPLSEWIADAKDLGFELRVDIDRDEYTIYVMLKPTSRKAKEACDRHLDEWCEMITVTTVYDKTAQAIRRAGAVPPPRDDEDRSLRISIDDSATYALSMARSVLEEAQA